MIELKKSFWTLTLIFQLLQKAGWTHFRDYMRRMFVCLNLGQVGDCLFDADEFRELLHAGAEEHFHIPDKLIDGKVYQC